MIHKLKTILSKKEIFSIYLFFILSFVTMALETAGVGLIIPFIQSFTSENVNENFIKILNFLNFYPETKKEIILTLIYVMLFVYTTKAIYLTYFSYAQSKLLATLRVSLSDKLYKIYLNKPYQFHLDNNSSKLIRNIDEINLVVALFQYLILFFTETIVLIGISTFVIIYEPVGSLIVIFFLGTFGFIFFKNIQSKIKKWGEIRQIHSGLRIKFLREGFSSIKDIKLLNRIGEILHKYTSNNTIINQCEIKKTFTESLPRLWLEWLAILGFILLIIVMISLNKDFAYIVSLLGLFAAAAFRLMPSLTRIMNSIQKIIYNRPAINSIYKEFEDFKKSVSQDKDLENISFSHQLNFKNLSFKYPDSNKLILNGLNFTIKSGATIGIIGESGTGKTTLINILLGLLQPTKGEILVDGKKIKNNLKGWQKMIGYVPQDVYIMDDTIKKNIAFALPEEQINKEQVISSIKKSRLEDFISNLEDGMNTNIGEFGDKISGGQRQRIAIARALYRDPKVLIFDEFTNSLDLETEKNILKEVFNLKGKKTVIMIAHRLTTLENCDLIYKIEEGKILEVKKK